MIQFDVQQYALPPANQLPSSSKFKLPEINDAVSIFEQDMEINLDSKGSRGPILALVYGPSNTGKTTSVLQYARHLIRQKNDILYIDLANAADKKNTDILLSTSTYSIFRQFVGKYRQAGNAPTIIFDHFEIVTNASSCFLCQTISKLYLDHWVNIVAISSNALAKQLFY